MIRSILAAVFAFALAGCAPLSSRVELRAAADVPRMSEEIECMTECLEDGSETCESCARSCFDRGPGENVASGL